MAAATGFCMLFLLLSALSTIVIPLFAVYGIIKWLLKLGKPAEEVPARELSADNLKKLFMEQAMREAAANIAAASQAAAPQAGPEEESARPAIARGSLKTLAQGESLRNAAVNKVALVQYMADATRAGQDENFIVATLTGKGWPEDEVADAFRSFQLLRA